MYFNLITSGILFIASSTEFLPLKNSAVSAIKFNLVSLSLNCLTVCNIIFNSFSVSIKLLTSGALNAFLRSTSFISDIAFFNCSASFIASSNLTSAVPSDNSSNVIPDSFNILLNSSACSTDNFIPAISISLSITKLSSNKFSIIFKVSSVNLPLSWISAWRFNNKSCSTSVGSLVPLFVTASIISPICCGKSSFCSINQSTVTVPLIILSSNSFPNSTTLSYCSANATAKLLLFLTSVVVFPYACKKLFNPLLALSKTCSISAVCIKVSKTTSYGTSHISDIVCAINPIEYLYSSELIAPSSYLLLTSSRYPFHEVKSNLPESVAICCNALPYLFILPSSAKPSCANWVAFLFTESNPSAVYAVFSDNLCNPLPKISASSSPKVPQPNVSIKPLNWFLLFVVKFLFAFCINSLIYFACIAESSLLYSALCSERLDNNFFSDFSSSALHFFLASANPLAVFSDSL